MPESHKQRVMIIAGEASGDMHAAKLVREVNQKNQSIEFYGIGGKNMTEAGVKTLVDSADLAVVGLFEVLAHWNTISGALKKMQHLLRTDPPDLLVLTDYPDFNLRLAKTAKECGVKVLYYISPQVWAWRAGRVNKIKRLVDHMAVILPFEIEFYHEHGVPATYVGHPLLDEGMPPAAASESLLPGGEAVIGLLPGSRDKEVARHLPAMLSAAATGGRSAKTVTVTIPASHSPWSSHTV